MKDMLYGEVYNILLLWFFICLFVLYQFPPYHFPVLRSLVGYSPPHPNIFASFPFSGKNSW